MDPLRIKLSVQLTESKMTAEVPVPVQDTFSHWGHSSPSVPDFGGRLVRGSVKSGVATRILAEEPRALYTHCYGHSINLAACDAIRRTKVMKDAMETAYEITKLIKYSPRREEIFRTQRASADHLYGAGLRVLCPTRWTVRADSLASIMWFFRIHGQNP